jgi:SAM-dependent methyltransferase
MNAPILERPVVESRALEQMGPATSQRCPNCSAAGLRAFYEVRNIPVHSVLLMPTRERAVTYPRRDLKLGFCPSCGFITNMIFDPAVHEYSTQCEETQNFSPTFSAFARELAKRWVDSYPIKGKTVIEVGCGKGEFLALMVELGVGHGIGIDPAYVPGRLDTPAADRLEFIQDLYSEKYTHLPADAVCCRHALEHIAPTGDFMRMIRRTLRDRLDTYVLFELPDVYRVLKEAAFWDIYYEHCSYFTTGSLARLFRLTGFDVIDLSVEYDNQYLIITGKPSATPTTPSLPGEDDLDSVTEEVTRFASNFARIKAHWLATVNGLRGEGKKIALWGGGSKAVSFLTTLGITEQVGCVVDINPFKQGKFIPGTGHPVVGPAALKEFQPDSIILMNPIYEAEVGKELFKHGLNPEILPV